MTLCYVRSSGSRYQAKNVTDDPNAEWVTQAKKLRTKFGMTPTSKPWTEQIPAPKLRGVPDKARCHEVIQIAWGCRQPKLRSFPWYVDVSQMAGRHPWQDVVPCLTQSSVVYDFEQDQVIGGRGMLACMGVPVTELKLVGFSPAELSSLAGEAMFAGCIGSLVLAVFLVNDGPWWNAT